MTTCRALVPVMDIQALTIINQLNNTGKKSAHQRAIASIKATTDHIHIEGALSILDALGYCNDDFRLKGEKWRIHDLGNERYFPNCQGRMADETPVFWFFGGPPTSLKWYAGTLQTFLDDRVLSEIRYHGITKVKKLIGIDLEGITNVPASAI